MTRFATPHRELREQQFPMLNRYWSDPAYAAECDAEAVRLNAESMAMMDRAIAKHPDAVRVKRMRERAAYEHQKELERG